LKISGLISSIVQLFPLIPLINSLKAINPCLSHFYTRFSLFVAYDAG
jgi:hypothetical protein